MANQKQLVLLSSGKTFWDKWRRTYPDVQAFEPDLHSADLHSADLHSADLHGADLTACEHTSIGQTSVGATSPTPT